MGVVDSQVKVANSYLNSLTKINISALDNEEISEKLPEQIYNPSSLTDIDNLHYSQNINKESSKPKQGLILNGKKIPNQIYKCQKYYFINTCPFDSLTEIFSFIYVNNQLFRNFVNSFKEASNYLNMIYNYVKSSFDSFTLYQDRAEVLFPISKLTKDID